MKGLPSYVADIVDVVVQEVQPQQIVLFGSYANGTATSDSDVDLLVIAETTLPSGARGRQLRSLLRDHAPRTDLIWCTPGEVVAALEDPSSTFVETVLRCGIVVYGATASGLVEGSRPAT